MLNLEEIGARLKTRRLDMAAKETGIHRNTIANIRDGKNKNPGYQILVKLSAYLSE